MDKLYRKRVIEHPLGYKVKTPLLIPSYSSSGFSHDSEKGKIVSEISKILRSTSEIITHSMLLSAFDIYYKNIPSEFWGITEITVVDSGGYENLGSKNLTREQKKEIGIRDWSNELYIEVLETWPNDVASMFVSFDLDTYDKSVKEQIELCKERMSKYRVKNLISFLLKPSNSNIIDAHEVVSCMGDFSAFDVLGITEKEIGSTIIERLVNVAKIRRSMDQEGISTPIHIFGCLEPISIILYFLVGAEMFDGLSWLRYGYKDNLAIYMKDYSILHRSIEESESQYKLETFRSNIAHLSSLRLKLRRFVDSGDFTELGSYSDKINEIYKTVLSELRG